MTKKVYNISLTAMIDGKKRAVDIGVAKGWDDLKQFLYSLLEGLSHTDVENVIITTLYVEDDESK